MQTNLQELEKKFRGALNVNPNQEERTRVCFNPGDITTAEQLHKQRINLEKKALEKAALHYEALKASDTIKIELYFTELTQAKAELTSYFKDPLHMRIDFPNNNAADNFVSNNPGNAQACGSTRDGVECNNRSVRAELKQLPEFIKVGMEDWTAATTN